MKGKVYTFDMESKLVAFTNDIESNIVILYIGGLGDTLLSTPFTSEMLDFCTSKKVRIIIPQLKSMPNYRIFPISSDVEDLHKIVEKNKGKKIILLGHSTGCQVSMVYLKKYGSKDINQVILQAPVSDVEYEESINP
jgi:pimeloyl-ACP methyl ester carboxylesterase